MACPSPEDSITGGCAIAFDPPILHINRLSYAYPGDGGTVLRDIRLTVGTGECCCITGPTGSGKSTLLMAIKDLLPPGRRSGETIFQPVKDARIGMVLQNPETQILRNTIGSEIAFGLENLCVPPVEMKPRICEALSAVGLDFPLDFPAERLSMGQKYRLILASVLVMTPSLILLDEPGAQLDPEGIRKLEKIILELKSKGVGFLICEHHPQFFSEVIDALWKIDELGHLISADIGKPESRCYPTGFPKRTFPECTALVKAENLSAASGSGFIWSSVNLEIQPGQRVAVYGENGAGKTTFLRCITGFVPPAEGKITVFGKPPTPVSLRWRTGCLFQNPQKQLFENTVFDEIAFPLKRMELSRAEIDLRVFRLLDQMNMTVLAEKSPHKLSFGQKHLVALAGVLIFSPRLLLLDDPFAGLDPQWRKKIQSILLDFTETDHMTLIWTGHQEDEMSRYADLIFTVSGGGIGQRT